MASKAEAFAGRVPKNRKTKKTFVQRIAKRVANFIIEQDAAMRERKLNRDAQKKVLRDEWEREVDMRAAAMRRRRARA